MKFIEVVNQKKFTLIAIFLFSYVLLNLLDGERGLISYYEKQKKIEQLIKVNFLLLIISTNFIYSNFSHFCRIAKLLFYP